MGWPQTRIDLTTRAELPTWKIKMISHRKCLYFLAKKEKGRLSRATIVTKYDFTVFLVVITAFSGIIQGKDWHRDITGPPKVFASVRL